MKILLLCMSCLMTLHASEKSCQDYLDMVRDYPSLIADKGNADKGEIEILSDPQKMADIESKTGRDVGLIKKDKYWIWLNDAVRFPSGQEGVYSRILWNKALDNPTVVGVCVLPFIEGRGTVLNCNYRHATRSWELELPRGAINAGETAEDAARRETLEETGKVLQELILLGHIAPDSGVVSAIVPIYYAKVSESQQNAPESTEAIEQTIVLSQEELKKVVVQGYYDCNIRGEVKRIHCRDPFLTYAMLMCMFKEM